MGRGAGGAEARDGVDARAAGSSSKSPASAGVRFVGLASDQRCTCTRSLTDAGTVSAHAGEGSALANPSRAQTQPQVTRVVGMIFFQLSANEEIPK